MSLHPFSKHHICYLWLITCLPTFSHASQPMNAYCASVLSNEAISMMVLQPPTQANDPIAMMITAALNQRYAKNLHIQEIQHLRENSKYELSFPFKSSLMEIKQVVQGMGYNAKGFRFKGAAVGVKEGDVGFLLDTRVYFTSVIVVLLAVTEAKRHILYGDGHICSMEKSQFEQHFADAKFLRLD